MIQTVPFSCSISTFVVEPNGFGCSKSASSRTHSPVSTVCCSVSKKRDSYIPKLEPFSRSRLDRALKDPPLIEKYENQIADYCVTLEGDECCSCWEAYLELQELEKEIPKRDLESLIVGAGGLKSLIGLVHGIAYNCKLKKERNEAQKVMKVEKAEIETKVNPCPIPDGLPKTQEELEEEEKARMPDSPFTRLLRVIGRRSESYFPCT